MPKVKKIILRNSDPEFYEGIQELCRKVYPFTKPWTIDQLESHRYLFPDGQLIAVEKDTNRVVGFAFSLIILWDDYSPQDTWSDFTSNGYFYNHNPKKGKTLYGAEIMVDPELRGRGIGKMLYRGREAIVEKYALKRIRAGARLRGYAKFQEVYSPHEYVKNVIEKKIYDPTLSFQLNQGFKAIDVAKNYLYDDPESLGFAAVIEWLNPKLATAADLKRQKESIEFFLSHQKFMAEFLPRELRRLVRRSTNIYGSVMKEAEGDRFLAGVESYRQSLKRMRSRTTPEALRTLQKQLEKEAPKNRLKLAHAFALHLELINCCETAYRTWKLRKKSPPLLLKTKMDLKFVLTAHPTEARSKTVVDLLGRVTEELLEGLNSNFTASESELRSLLHLLWRIPLGKSAAPTVVEEAEYLFSIVFSRRTFDALLVEKPSYDLKLRTWVGGDKDGHPGVDADVMVSCFHQSRRHIVEILQEKLERVIIDMEKVPRDPQIKLPKMSELQNLVSELSDLSKITDGDGTRVKKWAMKFSVHAHKSDIIFSQHHQVILMKQLLHNFPAFVIPVELREDAGKIKEALSDKSKSIHGMLTKVARITGALPLTSYVRGFVISHCEEVQDLENAGKLIELCCKTKSLPVIPLFESRHALENGGKILRGWLKDRINLDTVKRHWLGYMEIMLGYSDSSKETGVLPSRRLIYKAMHAMEAALAGTGVKPSFFHGSGGSVDRGGGSVKDQIAWWPKSAIERPKVTVQGEMVQRTFATKEILNSHCLHFSAEASKRRIIKGKIFPNPVLDKFTGIVQDHYQKLLGDSEQFTKLLGTTPYDHLVQYKIGSRPGKRVQGELSIDSLRAIPWILSWTQTRSLIPTWWGIGTAWVKLSPQEKEKLKATFKSDPFFHSFLKTLGYTLAKVELVIWEFYSSGHKNEDFFRRAELEYKNAVRFVRDISGEKRLIWHRPWLEESIRLRSPEIHILNLLQVLAIRAEDKLLLRETLVGISSGMLTTG